jgi:hypothetical protein
MIGKIYGFLPPKKEGKKRRKKGDAQERTAAV